MMKAICKNNHVQQKIISARIVRHAKLSTSRRFRTGVSEAPELSRSVRIIKTKSVRRAITSAICGLIFIINYSFIPKLKDKTLRRLMGNEKSALSGLEIEEKAIEITDFWLQHSASLNRTNNPQSISVFISEPSLHTSASFGKPSPLERAAKVSFTLLN